MNERIVLPPPTPKLISGRKPEFDFRSLKPGAIKRYDCSMSVVKRKLDTFIYSRRTFDRWYYVGYETVASKNSISTVYYVYRAHDEADRLRVDALEGRERFNFFVGNFEHRLHDPMEALKARYIAEGRQWPPVE